jgi:hypothetical protein
MQHMNNIKDHISLSKNVVKCKECKSLMLVAYLGNQLCKDCDKKYIRMINTVCAK